MSVRLYFSRPDILYIRKSEMCSFISWQHLLPLTVITEDRLFRAVQKNFYQTNNEARGCTLRHYVQESLLRKHYYRQKCGLHSAFYDWLVNGHLFTFKQLMFLLNQSFICGIVSSSKKLPNKSQYRNWAGPQPGFSQGGCKEGQC